MTELTNIAAHLRRCGEAFIGLADALENKPDGDDKKEPPKPLELADVRKVLVEKSDSGYKEEVRALVLKHGAEKLPDIDPSEYAALIAEAEALGNG